MKKKNIKTRAPRKTTKPTPVWGTAASRKAGIERMREGLEKVRAHADARATQHSYADMLRESIERDRAASRMVFI